MQFYRGLKLRLPWNSPLRCLRVVQFYRGLKPYDCLPEKNRGLRVVQFYRGLKLMSYASDKKLMFESSAVL